MTMHAHPSFRREQEGGLWTLLSLFAMAFLAYGFYEIYSAPQEPFTLELHSTEWIAGQ